MELLRRTPDERPSGREVLRRLEEALVAPSPSVSQGPYQMASVPFVGREKYLLALAEAFGVVQQGHAVSLFVHGRSGLGKSALVHHFLQGLIERDQAVVLAGRCYERESVPYKALDSLVDALSHYLRRFSRLEVEALLPRDIHALSRVFPVLRRVEGVAAAPRRAAEIPDQQELRRRASAALRELLARLGDRTPLILYIDDLQWGDVDSAMLLADLLRPPDPPLLLLLGCYRSEDAAASAFLRTLFQSAAIADSSVDHRELAVDALTHQEVFELAITLLGRTDATTQAQASTIAQESAGNPFFAYQLVQHVQADVAPADRSSHTGTIALDDVLWQRIKRLPQQAQHLLEVVAVAGQPLRQMDACEAAELGPGERTAPALLRSVRLIRTTGLPDRDEIETYHDRIRETVVAHVSPAVLQNLHRRLAGVLETVEGMDPEVLAIHFQGAGESARAGEYYARAASKAAETLAFDHAAMLYRRSLELQTLADAERGTLLIRLGDALANAGRGLEAAKAYQLAATSATAEQALELERRAALHFCISGHVDEGRAAFQRVLQAVGMTLPRSRWRAMFSLVFSWLRLRLRGLAFQERDRSQIGYQTLLRLDITQSVAMGFSIIDPLCGSMFQTRNLLLGLRAGEPFRIAQALAWEAGYASVTGGKGRDYTEKLLEACKSVAHRINHPHALGSYNLALGISELLAGRYKTAYEWNDRAQHIFRSQCTGVTWELDTAHIFGLWSLFYMGELASLRQRFEQLQVEAQDRGDRYLITTVGAQVGTFLLLAADKADEARERLHELMARWSQSSFNIQHHNAYLAQQQLDLYQRNTDAAWHRQSEHVGPYRQSLLLQIQHIRIDLLQIHGRIAIAAAQSAKNRHPFLRVAKRCVRDLRREKMPWSDALALMLSAGIAALEGNRSNAVNLLTDAVAKFESVNMVLCSAAARLRLGELLGGEQGTAFVEQANAWMQQQGIKDPSRMAFSFAPGFESLARRL